MKTTIVVVGVVLALSGCAGTGMFTAKTTASAVLPGGARYDYSSDKEYQGVDVRAEFYESGELKALTGKIDKGGTPADAIKAAAEGQAEWAKFFRDLLPLMKEAGALGAGS